MQAFETEERVALVDAVQRLLRDKSTESDVRRTMETERGYDPDLWKQLADMGLLGLIVDTANGGSGGGPIELELVMEEIGAALLCSPFLSSAVLATALLNACGDETAKKRLLPALVSGDRIATAALTGEKGLWTRDDVSVAAAQAGDRWTLDGVASYVTHGQAADVLLVVASVGSDVGVFEVDAKAEGLQVAPLSTFDLTLRLAKLLAEGGADADTAVSLAAFACADAFTMVTATSIQMHGGIAFTWDYPAHLYFRRARADAQLFGNPSFHRERYLTTLGA
jgi:alkylation response protein AidB-like acyl-CoA dehydrogenase